MLGITTTVFDELRAAFNSKKFNVFVLEGGSRSSKTFSIIQFWILWAYANIGKEKRVVVSRLKGTWLAGTVYLDFLKILRLYKLYDRKNENKSNKIYKLFDVEFWFIGLDDPQKIHGMETDAFWINEAVEAGKDDYDQLMQRCKGFAILDYNPSEEEHWIYDSICKREKTWYHHSTMLMNPLISQNAKEQILSYEPTETNFKAGTADKRKWDIYGLGKRAKIEGLVFDNWEIIKNVPDNLSSFQGVDFGYSNDVTAIGNVDIFKGENALYVDEICYRTHMLTSDIIRTFKTHNYGKKIWSESADPRLIDEIYNAGFNIHPVEKFKGSVVAGIDKMKSMKIYITEKSLNTIKEFKNYTYQQDKTGKWLNEPIDDWNHMIDATRYVVLSELLGKRDRRMNVKSVVSKFR